MNDESSDQPQQKSWLTRLSSALLREPQDRDQLIELLRDAESRQLLDAEALSMIEGVLQVSEMKVNDIMVPRSQMVVVSENESSRDFLPKIVATTHSRFPVIGDNLDEVIGILHAKDLLQYHIEDAKEFNIRDILRPVVFVPESKRLDALLKEFRLKRNHMALVVDEYGGISGMVTIEDVLEQIVGDIEDEFDVDEDAYIKKHSETKYSIKALTPIEDFNEYFNASLKNDEVDTIGGLIMKGFGHMPKRGESLDIGRYHFEVLKADRRRIHLLQTTLHTEQLQD
jgi:hemolysin (HlyC) family protein